MQSNFDSEIRKISKALIIFSTKTNLFLTELMFRWPIIVFKTFSILCLRIRRMSLLIEKRDSEFSEEREPWPLAKRLCLICSQTDSKLLKKFLTFLTIADIPLWFRSKSLLCKCHLTLVLLCIFSLVHVSFKILFTASAFSLSGSPRGTIPETTTSLFSDFKC